MSSYTISASQIGAVLGVDPRRSPLALYHQLKGEVEPLADNELLMEGREFEDAIARIACKKYGLTILSEGAKLSYDSINITGTTDRIVMLDDGNGDLRRCVLEIKNTRHGSIGDGQWGDAGSDQVPLHYWFQVQIYTWLLRQGYADSVSYGLLAAHLNNGTVLYKIPLDLAVIEKVRDAVNEFITRLESDNPPDPRDEDDMRKRWLVREEAVAEGGAEQLSWVNQLRDLGAKRREIEAAESQLKTLLLGFAQDRSKIAVKHPQTGELVVIATLGADRQFDADRFLADNPLLASQYMRLDTTRLGKEQRKVYEQYMRRPDHAAEQKRTIRLKEVTL